MELDIIRTLKAEHQLILKALDAADVFARRLAERQEVKPDELKTLADFIVSYSDEFHHKKEEDVLFRWMAEKGFPVEGGPIAVMLSEHEAGRDIVRELKSCLKEPADTRVLGRITDCLGSFSAHLRQHIDKEDSILYPMACRLSAPGDDAELTHRCRAKVSAEESERINARYTTVVEALVKTCAG